jgi:hypothetical protein
MEEGRKAEREPEKKKTPEIKARRGCTECHLGIRAFIMSRRSANCENSVLELKSAVLERRS